MIFSNILQIVNGLVVVVGIPLIVNMFIGIGKKFQKLDSLDEFVRKDIYPDIKNLKERMSFIEGRLSYPKESV